MNGMRMRFLALLMAGFAGVALAQPGPGGPGPGQGPGKGARFDCAKAADPAACEQRRAERRQRMEKAQAACAGIAQEARRECMMREVCAGAPNPERCRERMARRGEGRAPGAAPGSPAPQK